MSFLYFFSWNLSFINSHINMHSNGHSHTAPKKLMSKWNDDMALIYSEIKTTGALIDD